MFGESGNEEVRMVRKSRGGDGFGCGCTKGDRARRSLNSSRRASRYESRSKVTTRKMGGAHDGVAIWVRVRGCSVTVSRGFGSVGGARCGAVVVGRAGVSFRHRCQEDLG